MKQGFTLVELSLSLGLIGVLSIIVLLTISNAVSSYHKGLTLNQINTVGMGVVDDMRTALQSSPGRFSAASDCQSTYSDNTTAEKCTNNGALSFVAIERYANVRIGDATSNVPVYGAFCTGEYSYIWNSGYFFNSSYQPQNVSRATFSYTDSNTGNRDTKYNFKLLKVADDNRAVCKVAAGAVNGVYYETNIDEPSNNISNNIDLSCNGIAEANRPTDLCGAIDSSTIDLNLIDPNGGIALYDLTSAVPAASTGTNNMFYAVSFILGTTEGGINVKSSTGDYCTTPEDYGNSGVENFDYCAINKFNFAAQATGG